MQGKSGADYGNRPERYGDGDPITEARPDWLRTGKGRSRSFYQDHLAGFDGAVRGEPVEVLA